MRRAGTWLVLATAVAVALAGCSDDAGPDDAASSSSSGSASGSADPSASSPGDSASPSGTADPSASPSPTGSAAPVQTEQPTRPPVALEAPADFGSGVQARIADRQAIEMTGRGPGEVSGPALAFTVEFTNSSAAAVDLSAATVSVDYSGNEASGFEGPPSQPVSGELAPGATASGVYVFGVPADDRSDITVSVNYSASLPIVLFAGDASS